MCTTSTSTGKYYVSIFAEPEIEDLAKAADQVGVDFGIKDVVVRSDYEVS